jgi:hypothetical protein
MKKEAKQEAENAKKASYWKPEKNGFKQKRILDEEVKERQKELRVTRKEIQ